VIFDATVVTALGRHRIACYREIFREKKSQSIQQTSLLSYFKEMPQTKKQTPGL
jgi:hypothetical protein